MTKLRIGTGFDTHPLKKGDGVLVIGGVTVKTGIFSAGHSDGDTLIHAIVDAILGATGNGNIGEWFPENSINKNRKSIEFLNEVYEKAILGKFEIINIDTVIILSGVHLSENVNLMKERIGKFLRMDPKNISIKPKSGNGRLEGFITAQAVCLVYSLEETHA